MRELTEHQARAILMVGAAASIAEIKAAYRKLARTLHPDHAETDAESQRRAATAMAELNLAWDTLRRLHADGLLRHGPVPESEFSSPAWKLKKRDPTEDECAYCGSRPTRYFHIIGIRSRVLVWSTLRFRGYFCRACSRGMCRESAYVSLTQGWWGVSLLLLPALLVHSVRNWFRASSLADELFRMGDVSTPHRNPSFRAKRVWRRPLSYILPACALVLLGSGIWIEVKTLTHLGGGSISELRFALSSPGDLREGSCLRVVDPIHVLPARCTNELATYEVAAVVRKTAECPETTYAAVPIRAGKTETTSTVGCLRRL